MPSICCVRFPHKQSSTYFGVPKVEDEKKKWEDSLGIVLKKSHRVCAAHFEKHDIKTCWESGEGRSKYTVKFLKINKFENQ